jgi:TetR/AcrR family transcriptional regulator, cholesterol catabolism regulator
MAKEAVTPRPARATATAARSNGRVRPAALGPPGSSNPVIGGTPLAELANVEEGSGGPRSKRATIIDEAVRRFGEAGYEHTKWSSVAEEVGIGQTALYHYFESKAHCLLSIMRLELARSHQRFLAARADGGSADEILHRALSATFEVSTSEILQLRIVLANVDVLSNPRPTEREEIERNRCLALTTAIEDSWTAIISQLLAEHGRDEEDPKIMAMAVLGLINSAWRWYRPRGRISVAELGKFYVAAAQRVVG